MKILSSWIPKILVLSLGTNLLFAFVVGYAVHKKGGMAYLAKRISSISLTSHPSTSSTEADRPKLPFSARYLDRKSIYEALPDEKNEIIFLGDSITDDGEWSELFRDLKIKNRGVPGDRTDGVLARIGEVLSSSPQKIFLMIGYNDLSRNVEIKDIIFNYGKIIRTIKTQSPRTKIYIQSVLPVRYEFYRGKVKNEDILKLNDQLKKICEKNSVTYVDLFSRFCDSDQQLHPDFAGKDGLHLNGQAYFKWKSIIKNYIYN
jgi:lysophospholipase L1-like esterase